MFDPVELRNFLAAFQDMVFRNDYLDLHCHPALKPYGRSFDKTPGGRQSLNQAHRSSLWKYDRPSVTDKLLNFIGGLTKFSQADAGSLARGGVNVVCASLYPLERPFVRNAIPTGFLRDLLSNLALGIGKKRIDHLQALTNYFADLQAEYDFYRQGDGVVQRLPGGRFRYKLVRNYAEIQALKATGDAVETICIIPTIEGLHVLNADLDAPPTQAGFLSCLKTLKQWEHPPFFITVAHHFWNHLCGHSPSLTKTVSGHIDQSEGLGRGITSLGRTVLRQMLSQNNGPRILPDLKHMSPLARQEFYELRRGGKLGSTDFPLLFSHAACNGLKSFEEQVPGDLQTAAVLNPVPINLYDEEIIAVARSGGLIGLQLDERRIVSAEARKRVKHSLLRHKIMHYRSELLWNQVRHIAETLDRAGLFAWDCMAIGSDFDGIIDSLNGFWTAEQLPFLADFLERHAHNYMQQPNLTQAKNHLAPDEIIGRLFSGNGHRFLAQHFV